MVCYAMLCCAILYYTILYYTIQYYTILYYTIRCIAVPQSAMQCRTVSAQVLERYGAKIMMDSSRRCSCAAQRRPLLGGLHWRFGRLVLHCIRRHHTLTTLYYAKLHHAYYDNIYHAVALTQRHPETLRRRHAETLRHWRTDLTRWHWHTDTLTLTLYDASSIDTSTSANVMWCQMLTSLQGVLHHAVMWYKMQDDFYARLRKTTPHDATRGRGKGAGIKGVGRFM